MFQDAGTLSGGEKTKLALAMLMVGRNNLLLLDEPTNNLDPQAKEALLEAVRLYQGTIVLVSHDTDFVEALYFEAEGQGNCPAYFAEQGIDLHDYSTEHTVLDAIDPAHTVQSANKSDEIIAGFDHITGTEPGLAPKW